MNSFPSGPFAWPPDAKGDLATAEQRIREAAQTNSDMLDLGDLELTHLPPELGALSAVRHLALGKCALTRDDNGDVSLALDSTRSPSPLRNLAPLASLISLTNLDISHCTGVTDLSPLAFLISLQDLDVSHCTGITDFSPLASLISLQKLDIASCPGISDLAPLASLISLQVIHLSHCSGVSDLAPLASLSGLRTLIVWDCPGVSDLAPLASISGLRTLAVWECSGVSDLAPLASLNSLQTLMVWKCPDVGDLSPLAPLISLQVIHLSHCSGVSDLAPLASLISLQTLFVWQCLGVSDLAPLASLISLQKLDLSHCPGVSDLAPLASLISLQKLDLSHCPGVSDLAPLASLISLQNLNLSHCASVSDLAPLASLISLQTLDLAHCRSVQSLPSGFASFSNLTLLDLRETAIALPPELVARWDGDAQEILRAYFLSIGGEGAPLNEVKVLVVGESEVGKTSLIRQLRGEDHNPKEDKTHGIERHAVMMACGARGEVRLNVWDFGGQEIMHATHQFFLTRRSVYVLVLDSRQNERQSRIDYWLRLIASFGGNSPVIVVCNKADQQVMNLNWDGLQRDYPQIKAWVKEVSCYQEGSVDRRRGLDGPDGLRGVIGKVVDEQVPHLSDRVPARWKKVKTLLEEDGRDYLSLGDYCAAAAKEEVIEEGEQRTLLALLHDLGSVLHFSEHQLFCQGGALAPDDLIELNVLNPAWVTGAIYKVLNDADLIRAGGRMELTGLRRVLGEFPAGRYPRDKERFILKMMERFELSFPYHGKPDEWFLPSLLFKNEVHTGDWSGALAFRYTYRVLPGSVLSRLMVSQHLLIAPGNLWLTGVMFRRNGCDALVRTSTEDHRLDITIRGGDAPARRLLLEVIRIALEHIHATFTGNLGIEEKVLVEAPGQGSEYVSYQDLMQMEVEKPGVEFFVRIGGRMVGVNVKDALNGVADDRQRTEERHRRELAEKDREIAGVTQAARDEAAARARDAAQRRADGASPDAREVYDSQNTRRPAPAEEPWWKTWAAIAGACAIGAGLIAALLQYLFSENHTRTFISVVAAISVFLIVLYFDPKTRSYRMLKFAVGSFFIANAAGFTLTFGLKNQEGGPLLNWNSGVGWSFNIAAALVILALIRHQRQQPRGGSDSASS